MKQFIYLLFWLPVICQAQQNVGIGILSPASRLHIHQSLLGSSPPSAIQLTSSTSGLTADDGLKLEINGNVGSLLNKESGLLSLGSGNMSSFHIMSNGKIGLNTTQTIGAGDFMLRSKSTTFGGMYIDSPNSSGFGKPFYGYSLDGAISMYHYYDAFDARFKFQFEDGLLPSLSFTASGDFLLNSNSQVNASTDLTLTSKNLSGFGGMYINSSATVSGRPFYGYATGGSSKAYHYYNPESNKWALNVGGGDRLTVKSNGKVGVDFISPEESLVVNGRIRLVKSTFARPNNTEGLFGQADDGTIVYNEDTESNRANFYGRINGEWFKMTDAFPGQQPHPSEEDVQKLKDENKTLKLQLDALEKRFDQLEAKIDK